MPWGTGSFFKAIEYGARRLTRIVTQPVYLTYRKVIKALNPTMFMTRVMGDVRKGFRTLITLRPSSLSDYFAIGRYYVAKVLALILAIVLLLVPVAYLKLLHPFVVSRFLVKTAVVNTAEVAGYTGRVRLKTDENGYVVYEGEMSEGRLTGKGELYDPEGNLIYRGEFVNEMYEGSGELFYPPEPGSRQQQVMYAGDFSNNQYNGFGQAFLANGSKAYEGYFKDDRYDGSGREYYEDDLVQPDTLKYEGTFVQGSYSGYGVAYNASEDKIYEGGFLGGKADGAGTVYEKDTVTGSYDVLYTGEFSSGKITGVGTLNEGGALLYEGELVDGKMQGTGKAYAGRQVVYDGQFNDNAYNGAGRLYDAITGELVYDGQFAKGKYSGEGRYFDQATGELIYEGSFYDGQYDGYGVVYDPATQTPVYEGHFHLNRLEGAGKLYDTVTGFTIYEGEFRDGKYHGQGREYNGLNGSLLYEGGYLNGLFNDRGTLYSPDTGAAVGAGVFREGILVTPVEEGVPDELNLAANTHGKDLAAVREEIISTARAAIPVIITPYSGDRPVRPGLPVGPDGTLNPGGFIGMTEAAVRESIGPEPTLWELDDVHLMVYDGAVEHVGMSLEVGADGRVSGVVIWNDYPLLGVATGMTREQIETVIGPPALSGREVVGEARMVSLGSSNRYHGRITNLSAQSEIVVATYRPGEETLRMVYHRSGECLLIEIPGE